MIDAVAKLLPSVNKFLDQIWPSVVATLIAAGLISGYNHAFSGHLQQPRMAMLKSETDATPVSAETGPQVSTVAMTKPAVPAAEYFASRERAAEGARVPEKEASAEAGKDQTIVKVAVAAPQPRPTNVANPVPRSEPRAAERHEPRVASVPYVVPPPAPAGPVTAVPMAPPSVIMAPPMAAAPPMAPLPDRQRPPYEAQAEDVPPPAPPHGPIGAIVNTLKPSSLFARAREFGERIEAAGNEILPNIRP
jgi:hypothetical protein